MNRFEIFTFMLCMISVQCQQDHEVFTKKERMSLFQSDSVPEYEIVSVVHEVKKRSLDEDYSVVFLKTFGKDLKLYLEPNDNVLIGKETKVWSAEPNSSVHGGVEYKIISNKTNFKILHDVPNMAAVTLDKDNNGNMRLHGTIGDDLVIRPLPERMHGYFDNKIRQRRNSFTAKEYENLMTDRQHTIPHVVYKKPIVKHGKAAYHGTLKKISSSKNMSPNSTNSTVDVVYPEILIFMDRILLAKLDNDVEVVKKYIASFWNAVDLRFRQLTNPMVRINIAGIILSKGKQEVPFIKKNINYGTTIDSDNVLIDIGQHLLSNEVFVFRKDYDLFMTMTNLDMCNFEANFYNCDTMGYAYVAAACSVLNSPLMVEAVGMVEDNGGFIGIMPSAHEVGHLLGVSHDEAVADNNECEFEEGYIMHHKISYSKNGFDWSPCSIQNFSIYLNNPSTECLRNKPDIGGKKRPFLPGIYDSLEKQCQQFEKGSIPCNFDASVCTALRCHLPHENCKIVAPAAEGSTCGNDSICLNGKCISKQRRNFSKYFYHNV